LHENRVVDGAFADLKEGTAVEMVLQADESEICPQAITVRPIGSIECDPGR
jgi:hypothetical protein